MVPGSDDVKAASPRLKLTYDETIKRRLYERAGVLEYWAIDPELDLVRVYRRADGGVGRPIELSAEAAESLRTDLLPGLDITLARLFEG